jgi:hypothetical protein
MKKIFLSFISKPYWSFVGVVLAIFAIFGIPDTNLREICSNYTWIIDATKWSLIFGAFLFAIHGYVRAEKNRKYLINIKNNPYDEAYNDFVAQLRYAIGRYNTYSSNLAPEQRKYTKAGVMERITEVGRARLRLLSVCGDSVRSLLLESGTEWLNDIDSFSKKAPSIEQTLSEIASKDRTMRAW